MFCKKKKEENKNLMNKMTGLVTFVKEANYIINSIDLSMISPYFNGKIINNKEG